MEVGRGNTSQNDPSNNPFQVTSWCNTIKSSQFLNSDIFNQYKYNGHIKIISTQVRVVSLQSMLMTLYRH